MEIRASEWYKVYRLKITVRTLDAVTYTFVVATLAADQVLLSLVIFQKAQGCICE